MDFIAVMKALVKEAKLLRNYKRMSKFMAVLSFLLLLPWISAFLGAIAAYYVCLAIYKLIAAPIEQIKGFLEESGKDVKHATQFLVYWIGFPLVWGCHVFLAFAAFSLHYYFFIANVTGYIATLGGITFAPFIKEQPNRELEYSKEKFGKRRVFFFAAFPYLMVICAIVLGLLGAGLSLIFTALELYALGGAFGAIFFVFAGLCGAALATWWAWHVLFICLAFKKGQPLEA